MKHNAIKQERKKYQKPKLTTIELNVDEVLAWNCKVQEVGLGPIAYGCNPPGGCKNPGS